MCLVCIHESVSSPNVSLTALVIDGSDGERVMVDDSLRMMASLGTAKRGHLVI